MAAPQSLPAPRLTKRSFGALGIPALTDDALFERTGVRVAFTGREGGASTGPYASLNLGSHVGDDAAAVAENRSRLLAALGAQGAQVIVPNQVHGDEVVLVGSPQEADEARRRAREGADALVVGAAGVAALLCFADCVPVVAVSPSGRFAVAHAGWRGVMSGVAAKAVRLLADADEELLGPHAAAACNVYVGPHIRGCCFETGADVREAFARRYGASCLTAEGNVSLLAALTTCLAEAGVDRARLVDAGVCTMDESERYFSYRASGGTCGRQGAIAFREAR